MNIDNKLKDIIIEMLKMTSIDTVIQFCEESGIEGECLELLRSEQQHSEISRLLTVLGNK
ncbi:MAG: hypothetical protein MJK04_14395 [Psychrosphaera sp.]|nr:hypothetical protein [Psychrosphaera sp.]